MLGGVTVDPGGRLYGNMAVLINETLCFVTFYYGKVTKSELLTTTDGFFDDEEVVHAKELIFKTVNDLPVKADGMPRLKPRKEGANKRRLDSEDILSLLEFVDKKQIQLPQFCAVNLHRIPRFTQSDVDTVRMAESVVDVKQQVQSLTAQFNELKQGLIENVASVLSVLSSVSVFSELCVFLFLCLVLPSW